MSYPKWITRNVAGYETFEVHNGELYGAHYDGLYHIESYCESSSVLQVTETEIGSLSATGWAMRSAYGLLWICAGSNLYSYDAGTDTLSGPWAIPIGSYVHRLEAYDDDIYGITRHSATPKLTSLLRFDRATNSWATIDTASPSGFFDDIAEFNGLLYFSNYYILKTWDGASVATAHTFASADRIGVLHKLDNTTLYVGTGSLAFLGENPKLWSWNSTTMSYLLDVDASGYNRPKEIAYKSATEVFVSLASTGGGTMRGVWLVDLAALTSTQDHSYTYYAFSRACEYRAADTTVWSYYYTRMASASPCVDVARTYFLLA